MVKFIIRDRITGAVKLDLSTRIPKMMGSIIATPNVAGSFVVPGDGDGQVWVFVTQSVPNKPLGSYLDVQVSGNTITWPAYPYSMRITYGRY